MKNISLILVLGSALILGLSSCVKEAATVNGIRPDIRANYPDVATAASLNNTWTEGDAFYLFRDPNVTANGGKGSYIPISLTRNFSIFSLASGTGQKSATFSSSVSVFSLDPAVNEKGMFYAAHPAKQFDPTGKPAGSGADNRSFANSAGNCTFDLEKVQIQDVSGSSLERYLLMWADPIPDGEGVAENLDFQFHHLCAILGFDIKNLPAGVSVTGVEIREIDPVTNAPVANNANACFPTRMTLYRSSGRGKYQFGEVTGTSYSYNMRVNMSAPVNANFTANIAVIPHDFMTSDISTVTTPGATPVNNAKGPAATRNFMTRVYTLTDGVKGSYSFDMHNTPTYWLPGGYYSWPIDFTGKDADPDIYLPPASVDVDPDNNMIYIYDQAGLDWVGIVTRGGTATDYNGFADWTINLMNDITLPDGNPNYDLYPIGKPEGIGSGVASGIAPFKGNFDGQGYTISNFYYHGVGNNDAMANPDLMMGLFGFCQAPDGQRREIINLNVTVDIQSNGPHNGALACFAKGYDFTNCSTAGVMSAISDTNTPAWGGMVSVAVGCNFTGCSSSMNITHRGMINIRPVAQCNAAGGLVAMALGGTVFDGCTFEGNLKYLAKGASGRAVPTGGICGIAFSGPPTADSFLPNIATPTIIKNCLNKGTVEIKAAGNVGGADVAMGGICGTTGYLDNAAASASNGLDANVLVIGCKNEGSVTFDASSLPVPPVPGNGQCKIGGIVGANLGGVVTGCYNTGPVVNYSQNATNGFGGICGMNYAGTSTFGRIIACYNTGTLTYYSNNTNNNAYGINLTGSIVGYNFLHTNGTTGAIVEECFYTLGVGTDIFVTPNTTGNNIPAVGGGSPVAAGTKTKSATNCAIFSVATLPNWIKWPGGTAAAWPDGNAWPNDASHTKGWSVAPVAADGWSSRFPDWVSPWADFGTSPDIYPKLAWE